MAKNSRRKLSFYPIEIVSFYYFGITALFILLFHPRLSDEWMHLFIRFFNTMLLVLAAYLSQKSKLIEYLRVFIPLVFLGFFYSETDYFNNLWFTNQDPVIAGLEQKIFHCQPSLLFQGMFPGPVFRECMYFGYFSYYLMIFAVCFILTRSSLEMGKRAVFFVVTGFYIFYLFFSIFPVAGPQYYFGRPEYASDGFSVFSSLMIFIQEVAERPTAAFPSSHVAMACIVLILASWKSTKLVLILFPFVVLLFFSTVYIQAHYLIDVLAGILIFPLVYYISHLLSILFEKTGFKKPEKINLWN